MPNSWLLIPIFWFILTAAAGAALRGIALLPDFLQHYVPLLHAHSHVALLGWGYSALVLLIVSRFVPEQKRTSPFFRMNFVATQLTTLGMFIAFSLQGYGFYSILFSTIHILLSYSFAVWMLRKLRSKPKSKPAPVSAKFAKAALLLMVLSSAGPWSLAVLSAKQLTQSPWYDAALYFYLHCQYNGWFTLGLFAVLYSKLEELGKPWPGKSAELHYKLYTVSVLPSFLLSLLWMELPPIWRAAAILSGLMQAAGIAAFFILWRRIRGELAQAMTGWSWTFLRCSLIFLGAKMTLELGSAIPVLESLAFSTRSVVIGYLHLVLLGFVSFMLVSFLLQQLGTVRGGISGAGCFLFLIGFAWNELILFIDGLCSWLGYGTLSYSSEMLFAASLIMLAGIGSFGFGFFYFPDFHFRSASRS